MLGPNRHKEALILPYLLLSPQEAERVLRETCVCYIAVLDGTTPYALPLAFTFQDGVVCLRLLAKGKRCACLQAHPSVCLVFSLLHESFVDSALAFGTACLHRLPGGEVDVRVPIARLSARRFPVHTGRRARSSTAPHDN